LEGVDKYLVATSFLDTEHGVLGCITCHGGENVVDQEQAHADLVVRPSSSTDGICADCHGDITETYAGAIHYTVQGMANFFETAMHPGVLEEEGSGFKVAFDNNCYKCHATCGSCHVSRPYAYGGGLHSEHMFAEQPPMDDSCFGCHGARNAGEYMGVVGYTRDIHYEKGMHCSDCHPVSNFHGTGEVEQYMYDVDLPSCNDCHGQVMRADSPVEAHSVHAADLMNCQVCHASANNNCFDCHATLQEDGSVAGIASAMRILFKIGLNPERTEDRPYKYMTLRHIPTVIDSFATLAEELKNYHSIPNWKYSPTHNVQRVTVQNESCDSCHGNQYIFLQERDLREDDSDANRDLVVDNIPSSIN
jgi:hypothetical protein